MSDIAQAPDWLASSPVLTVVPNPDPTKSQRFTVACPAGAPAAQAGYALVNNSSAYAVQIDIGGRPLGTLPAGVTNQYALGTLGAQLGVTVPAGTTATSSTGPQTVLVDWSSSPQAGTWPAGVNTQAIAAAISGFVSVQQQKIATGLTTGNINSGSPPSLFPLTLPSWTKSIGIAASAFSGLAALNCSVTILLINPGNNGGDSATQRIVTGGAGTFTFPEVLYLDQFDPDFSEIEVTTNSSSNLSVTFDVVAYGDTVPELQKPVRIRENLIAGEQSSGRISYGGAVTTVMTAPTDGVTVIDSITLDDSAAANIAFFTVNSTMIGGVGIAGGNFVANTVCPGWRLAPGDVLKVNTSNGAVWVTVAWHVE